MKLRQPLSKLKVKSTMMIDKELLKLLLEETNIKEIDWQCGNNKLNVKWEWGKDYG